MSKIAGAPVQAWVIIEGAKPAGDPAVGNTGFPFNSKVLPVQTRAGSGEIIVVGAVLAVVGRAPCRVRVLVVGRRGVCVG